MPLKVLQYKAFSSVVAPLPCQVPLLHKTTSAASVYSLIVCTLSTLRPLLPDKREEPESSGSYWVPCLSLSFYVSIFHVSVRLITAATMENMMKRLGHSRFFECRCHLSACRPCSGSCGKFSANNSRNYRDYDEAPQPFAFLWMPLLSLHADHVLIPVESVASRGCQHSHRHDSSLCAHFESH